MIELLVTLSVWVGSYDSGEIKSHDIIVKTHHASCEEAKPDVFNIYHRDYVVDGDYDNLRVDCRSTTL